jgi:hypothetical protein
MSSDGWGGEMGVVGMGSNECEVGRGWSVVSGVRRGWMVMVLDGVRRG